MRIAHDRNCASKKKWGAFVVHLSLSLSLNRVCRCLLLRQWNPPRVKKAIFFECKKGLEVQEQEHKEKMTAGQKEREHRGKKRGMLQ